MVSKCCVAVATGQRSTTAHVSTTCVMRCAFLTTGLGGRSAVPPISLLDLLARTGRHHLELGNTQQDLKGPTNAMYRLLDLCCGAGGASVGYARAGFDVTGVDVAFQSRYPFAFIHGDATTVDLDGFDAFHASPPCQRYSCASPKDRERYPDLIAPLRERLQATGKPYVLENVIGAPLIDPMMLCAASFGCTAMDEDESPLVLRRHRLFESNWPLVADRCRCGRYEFGGFTLAGVYGNGGDNRPLRGARGGYTPNVHVRRVLMGIDWMSRDELSEAIPPAFTEHIGAQLLETFRLMERANDSIGGLFNKAPDVFGW